MFAYSQRDKTHAARHLPDDVQPEVKQRRLAEARRRGLPCARVAKGREGLTSAPRLGVIDPCCCAGRGR